jgi:hypothetical protein
MALYKLHKTGRRAGVLLGRVVRTMLMGSVLLLCYGVFALRSAYGRANDAGLIFSEQLLSLDSGGSGVVGGESYRIRLNGESVSMSSTASSRPFREVLDYFETQCTEHAEGLDRTFSTFDTSVHDLAPSSGAPGFGVMKRVSGDSGFVACFSASHVLTNEETAARLKEAIVSGDLSKLGDFRYVAIEKAGKGSHAVAMWTDGAMMLGKMFPKQGDAPGFDWPNAPRPDGSRRFLTAYVEGAGYGVTVYQVDGSAESVRAGIDGTLSRVGWSHMALPKQVPAMGTAYYRPGDTGADLVVATHESAAGKTSVSYLYSSMLSTSAR